MATISTPNRTISIPGEGDSLPNGAIILDETVLTLVGGDERMRESVVLAMRVGAVHDRFVTWVRHVSVDDRGAVVDTCSWGIYMGKIDKAVRKYRQRVNERQGAKTPRRVGKAAW